jgi:hypothetical protein
MRNVVLMKLAEWLIVVATIVPWGLILAWLLAGTE